MCITTKCITISGSSLATIVSLTASAIAQSNPPPETTIPPTTPEIIEQTIPKPSDLSPPLEPESPSSLPEPNLQTPATPQQPEVTSPSSERFLIRKVEVRGTTVLQSEIADIIKKIENQEVTFEELINLRSQITKLYIDNGYVTSGAFLLNNQPLSTGIVEIQVIEGELERIEVSGLNRLQPGYVRNRIAIASATPLNQQNLEEALQLLLLNPLLEQVNAELTAGNTPGRNILQLQLREAQAFGSAIVVGNSQSPSIGSMQASLVATHENLLGFGDRLSAQYNFTEGLDLYDFNYTIPLNPRDGTLSLRYSNSDSRIVEDQFRDLDISSETRTFSVNWRQPVSKSPETELALGLALDLRRNQTFLEDDPFAFRVEGPENGDSKITVIRFFQDWVDRSTRRVLAARSQFSLGIDAFDATINDTGTDGQFFSWLGQFQWVQQLSSTNLLVARVAAQLTPDSLLSLERFGMGGVGTIRGYRQNQLVTDNGILGSVEVRIPLSSDSTRLQLVPFFDIGTAWNNRDSDPDTSTIAGLGVALRWLIGSNVDLRLDYGIPLMDVDNQGDSLQDDGIYFSISYQP